VWDVAFSRLNSEQSGKSKLTIAQAWSKQRGKAEEKEVTLPNALTRPSADWKKEQLVYLIDRQKEQLAQATINTRIAGEKIVTLERLKTRLLSSGAEPIEPLLKQEQNNRVYNQHRLFALAEKTETQTFIDELPKRFGAS
jgi:hypothetical protein